MTDFGPKGFTADDVPDQSGKTFVITGANSGIGLEAARLLGSRGGRILMLCRSMEKAGAAAHDLRQSAPLGRFEPIPLDLSRLDSVRGAASAVNGSCDGIDGLINNAGIMMIPMRQLTEEGFEAQFGVNVLGHFALNGLLAAQVERAGGRFVTVSSIAHQHAKSLPLDDLTQENGYSPIQAYAASKLGNLVYAIELQRRLTADGSAAMSVACHPGWSDTNLATTGPSKTAGRILSWAGSVLAQPAEKGALPTVLAATSAKAKPGGYYGPKGFQQFAGPVRAITPRRLARNKELGVQLWRTAVSATGVDWLTSG